ncbi:hypothetical protein KAR91_64195 [Candidatus Pacearchaeota archaeon]|nr:hypothetical protein [Candidatus Pacearchaeota archaeon]
MKCRNSMARSSSPLRWFEVRLNCLGGETILVVLDENYLLEAQESEPDKVVYTFSELLEIDRSGIKRENMRMVYMVKKSFNGAIVPWDSPLGQRLRRDGFWE